MIPSIRLILQTMVDHLAMTSFGLPMSALSLWSLVAKLCVDPPYPILWTTDSHRFSHVLPSLIVTDCEMRTILFVHCSQALRATRQGHALVHVLIF